MAKGFRKDGSRLGFQKGQKHPKEQREKAVKHPNYGMKGKGHSEETKKKIRKSRMGKTVGSKHPNWKGGTSRAYKDGYYSIEYKKWRMKVFERDNFTCINCGIVGGYLTAHHIKSFKHYPELRFDVDNGVTLCEDCHKLTDNYKGKNKNKRRR